MKNIIIPSDRIICEKLKRGEYGVSEEIAYFVPAPIMFEYYVTLDRVYKNKSPKHLINDINDFKSIPVEFDSFVLQSPYEEYYINLFDAKSIEIEFKVTNLISSYEKNMYYGIFLETNSQTINLLKFFGSGFIGNFSGTGIICELNAGQSANVKILVENIGLNELKIHYWINQRRIETLETNFCLDNGLLLFEDSKGGTVKISNLKVSGR